MTQQFKTVWYIGDREAVAELRDAHDRAIGAAGSLEAQFYDVFGEYRGQEGGSAYIEAKSHAATLELTVEKIGRLLRRIEIRDNEVHGGACLSDIRELIDPLTRLAQEPELDKLQSAIRVAREHLNDFIRTARECSKELCLPVGEPIPSNGWTPEQMKRLMRRRLDGMNATDPDRGADPKDSRIGDVDRDRATVLTSEGWVDSSDLVLKVVEALTRKKGVWLI